MAPQPIYRPGNLHGVAYELRYSWHGWPSGRASFPHPPPDPDFERLCARWESDGLRLLERRWKPALLQFTFSVQPHVSPVFFTARVKGRLQHALHHAGTPAKFSRKVGFRTIGNNRRTEVESYVRKQVEKEPVADERFKELLRQFTVVDHAVDLFANSAVTADARGGAS